MPSLEKMCSNAQHTVSAPGQSRFIGARAQMLDREVVSHELQRGDSDISL